MIDILYLVGPDGGARGDGTELRWSLRSVAKYARNVGRVIVAGYPPEWLSKEVARLAVPDGPPGLCMCKFRYLWRKAFAAIDEKLVSGDFLVSCDDHFYTAPVDAEATPAYFRSLSLRATEATDNERRDGEILYRRSLVATRETLVRAGYSARDCAGHCNFRCHTGDAETVRRIAAQSTVPNAELGFDLGSMFLNVRAMREPLRWVHRKDWKCRSFSADAVASGQFSIHDAALEDPKFLAYMDEEFGTPCKYEEG